MQNRESRGLCVRFDRYAAEDRACAKIMIARSCEPVCLKRSTPKVELRQRPLSFLN